MDLLSLIDEKNTGNASIGYGLNDTLDIYIAAIFVKKGKLPKIGTGLYTYKAILGGLSVLPQISNFQHILKDLAFDNKAIFIPKGYMNGTKNDTVNLKKGTVFGLNSADANTGVVTESGLITLDNYYSNVSGLNALRADPFGWDIVLVTNNALEIIYADQYLAQIGDVLDAVSGNNAIARTGRINWMYRGNNGQVVPTFGINPDWYGEREYLNAQSTTESVNLFFVIGQSDVDPVNLTESTCSGEYKRWVRGTPSTLSTLSLDATPEVNCVSWEIMKVVNGIAQPATGANDATISVVSGFGLVSFPSNHPAGTTRYIVTVKNDTGIFGKYYLEVVI